MFFTSMIQFLNPEITTENQRETDNNQDQLEQLQALRDTVREEKDLTEKLYEESGRFEALYLHLRNLVEQLQFTPNNSREEDILLQTLGEKRKEIREVKKKMDQSYRALKLVKSPGGTINPDGADAALLFAPTSAGSMH